MSEFRGGSLRREVRQIQLFINLVLFLWLLLLTALVVRSRAPGALGPAQSQDHTLLEQVEDGQRLINSMSEDLLALSQRMMQDLDELRTTVQALESAQHSGVQEGAIQPSSVIGATVAMHPSLERYRDVYQRAAQGKTVTEIAKELGMGKGEVELVLTLGQQQVFARHKS
ncbi:MAG: DUF6115 domain-containing protein [Bacillota bacterium]